MILKFAKHLRKAKLFAQETDRLRFSKQARRLWIRRYRRLSAEVPGMLGAITSRAEAQVLRLSMIYALLERTNVIDERHLRAALAVWRYCAQSARYIFGGSLGDAVADRILEALRKNRKGLSGTAIRELFARNLSAERIKQALIYLLQNQLASCAREETNGRPLKRWSATQL